MAAKNSAQLNTMSTPVAHATQRARPLSSSSRGQAPGQQRQRTECAAEPHRHQRVLARLFHKHADGAQQHAPGDEQPLAVALALDRWLRWLCGG
jgi:hypothetical protein